ncbi:MAG TPA: lytic transglycosylase F, partial [Ignavibacteriaceae bacterium]
MKIQVSSIWNKNFNTVNEIYMKKKYFYIITILFPLIFIFLSCNDVEKNNEEIKIVKDTTEVVEYEDETIEELLPSFFISPNIIKVGMGDFDIMLERRVIRVLVPYSRTLFFNDKGRERGITAETVREFEMFLNQKYKSILKRRPITITIIPTPRDQLFTSISQGLGDIAAGNITVTEKRLEMVDFIAPPELPNISEIIITRKQDARITSLEELSGKTVHVRVSSSYYESLQKLNEKFAQTGKSKINIVPISEYLEDEDLMEMLDAGIISMIVVDDWKAKMWAQILNNIVVNDSIAITTNGNVGWAYRKNSPLLLAELKEFYYKFEKNRQAIPHRFVKYSKQVKQLQDPTKRKNWNRYQETIKLFEKYGSKYEFDALMLAALGFQESQLDQSRRSHVGAIGVMQLMP